MGRKIELLNITLELNLQQALAESCPLAQVMGAPGECSGSFYFKDERFWVLHTIPVLVLKPRSFHKRLAVRYRNRAQPINLLPQNDLSFPHFSLPLGDPGKSKQSMGIDDLTIKAEDSNCGWSAWAGPCCCQSYRDKISNSDSHLLQMTFSRWPSALRSEAD